MTLFHLYSVIWIKLTMKKRVNAMVCQKPVATIHCSFWCLCSRILPLMMMMLMMMRDTAFN